MSEDSNCCFIFVTGGVLSSLGKGIFASSLARLLQTGDVKVALMKIDPYLNCDAGTLNPFEHGEVFVTRDGHECDLDLGNYERFLGRFARREQNLMMGSVYKALIENERHGDYLGKTLQLIPHATNEIKRRVRETAGATGARVLIVEIGGTVGDLESDIVLEAARQMKFEEFPGNVMFTHLALVPTITTGEVKTKPMQHSVAALMSRGITPDVLVGRADRELLAEAREKIALLCSVPRDAVFTSPTVPNVYRLPSVLRAQGLQRMVARKLNLKMREEAVDAWDCLLDVSDRSTRRLNIAVVGKYAVARDAYRSVFESIVHAAMHTGVRTSGVMIDSESIENGRTDLAQFDAFIVPGGFGSRGVEGKIKSIRYARENHVPFLGLCYGFQLSVVEVARNVLGWQDAHTTEVDECTAHPVIDLLPEQRAIADKGGTMRLGVKPLKLRENTVAHRLYGDSSIEKRFRHRFEMNPQFIPALESAGVVFSGMDPSNNIMKVLELRDHPFFMGVQYHPEFDSRLEAPEPLFRGLLEAAVLRRPSKQVQDKLQGESVEQSKL